MSFVVSRPDVSGYADRLEGDDRDVLKLRPGIIGPAMLKYRLEDEMIYFFIKDIQMIFCTVLGKNMEYAGETI